MGVIMLAYSKVASGCHVNKQAQEERCCPDRHHVRCELKLYAGDGCSTGHHPPGASLRAINHANGPVNILHFDAHPDVYDDFEGNPHSHASPFARVLEKGLAKRLVQVGIRTLNQHQRDQVERFGVECFEMKYVDLSSIGRDFDGPVYISCDMDALDPGSVTMDSR